MLLSSGLLARAHGVPRRVSLTVHAQVRILLHPLTCGSSPALAPQLPQSQYLAGTGAEGGASAGQPVIQDGPNPRLCPRLELYPLVTV